MTNIQDHLGVCGDERSLQGLKEDSIKEGSKHWWLQSEPTGVEAETGLINFFFSNLLTRTELSVFQLLSVVSHLKITNMNNVL